MEKRKKSDNSPNNPKETQETTLRQNQKKILTKKDLTNLDDFIQKVERIQIQMKIRKI